jgi:hypothetical protein
MAQLDLEGMDALVELRDKTPPAERHFFVSLDATGVHVDKVHTPRISTYGEALALRQFLELHPARKVIVISTYVHLRRVAIAFAHVFRDSSIEFRFCPVPPRFERLKKSSWFVIREMMKLGGYAVILSTPAWAVRRLMRLKQ